MGGWSSQTGEGSHDFTWDFSENHTVSLSTNFSANFKAKDWLNIGGSVDTNSQFSANVATTGALTLHAGEKGRPYMRYTIRTQHKLVNHFDNGGFDANPARADGKWSQAADLPLRVPADIEALWQGPININVGGSPDPS